MIPIGAARAIGVLTVASRLLGMVREMAFAYLFGAGAVADAFRVAFQLPNTFRRIFGEGALASAMIPVLSRVRAREGTEGVRRLAEPLLATLAVVLGAFTLVVSGGILAALGPISRISEDPEKARLIGWLAAALFPYVILICLTAAQGGMLNTLDRFTAPAVSPILFNCVCLMGLLAAGLAGGDGAVWYVAGAILTAGVVQYASQAWSLRRAAGPFRMRASSRSEAPELTEIFRGMVPVALGLAPAQIGVLADTWIAHLRIARHGAVAHLGYGHILMHLPLAVVGVSIATASFPLFSRLAARGDLAGLARARASACRQAFFLLAPAAVGLALLSVPIVRLLYERGEFTAQATGLTARVTTAYAAGLPAYAFQQILARVFYALDERGLPARVGALAVALNVALNLAWVGRWGEGGIALASAVAAWVGAGMLAWLLRRRLAAALPPCMPRMPALKRTAIASARFLLGVGAGCATLAGWLAWAAPRCAAGGAMLATQVVGTVLCGVCLYGAVAWMTGSDELRALLGKNEGET